jgi:ABC-type microcin C transport system duplicated ATPase subunit YejF
MASPPPPVVAKPDAETPEKTPAPAAPLVAPWVPPAKVVEVTAEAVASIHAGMKRDEVLRRIGAPLSKLAIPEENELVETYRYAVSAGRAATVRFSDGIVTDVQVSQP